MAIHNPKLYARIAAGLAAAIVLLAGSFWNRGGESTLERWVLDRAQRAFSSGNTGRVAVVGIDADSRSHLGEWPWPNSLHAQLIQELHKAGSKGVVFTVPLGTARNAGMDRVRAAMAIMQSAGSVDGRAEELRQILSAPVTHSDEEARLANAMTAQGQVFLSAEIALGTTTAAESTTLSGQDWPQSDSAALAMAPSARLISAPSGTILEAARGVGHIASPADSDGTWRRELTGVNVAGHLLPAVSVLAAAAAMDTTPRYNDDTLTLANGLTIELNAALGLLPRLPPATGDNALPVRSYWQVLLGNTDLSDFKDKVVFIGFTDGPNADRVNTATGPAIPRVLVSAGTTQSLIERNYFTQPLWSMVLQWLASLGVIAFAVMALPLLRPRAGALLGGSLAAVLLAIEFALLAAGVWLPLSAAVLAVLLACATYMGVSRKWLNAAAIQPAANSDGLRTLALTLQGQGQLDLAFETFRRCPTDTTIMDLLYRLGADYERRRQLAKAGNVYAYLASLDPQYRDCKAKSERFALETKAAEKTAEPVSVAPAGAVKGRRLDRTAAVVKTPPPAAQQTKETLGRYEIERQIGKGAMGVVYLGRDPKINRIVAIKAIPLAEEFEDSDLAEARERFFREAEMAGRLNHPGIVTVYDAGEDHGLAYIAMEFLSGEHLSFYAEPQNLLPVPKVLALAARLADALDYAHHQNVVHRDIKPANIMFNVETDTLKITDFGIARLTDVSRTKTGIVLGTPSFMSPEQLEGRPIDGRSDLFALGVALYQLLSAQLPFRADSMTRLMNKIATEPHTPIRSIRPELPAELETILERALAKNPERRYTRGAEMAEALRSCMRSLAA